jgi:mRNA interferase MazF
MTNYQLGDLVLVAFPHTGKTRTKNRPALVVLDTGDADVVVARVTTQLYQTSHDILIMDWPGAGLLAPSVARLHKLATLEKTIIRRKLGQLQPTDRQRVASVLQQTYGTW